LIIESILIVAFALGLDFAVGDPKNKFHPTAWIGKLVAILTPHAKKSEKLGGVLLVLGVVTIVVILIVSLEITVNLITMDFISRFAFLVGIIVKKENTELISLSMNPPS